MLSDRRTNSEEIEAKSGLCIGGLICTQKDQQIDGTFNLHFERRHRDSVLPPFTGSKLTVDRRVIVSEDRLNSVKSVHVQRFYVSSGTIRSIEPGKLMIHVKHALGVTAPRGTHHTVFQTS
jgi:hypothetical protein